MNKEINTIMLKRYLLFKGWNKFNTNYSALEAYKHPHKNFFVSLSKDDNADFANKYLCYALNFISKIKNKSINELKNQIFLQLQ